MCGKSKRLTRLIKDQSNDKDFRSGSDGKESGCNAGDLCLIPGWGRSPGEGNGKPLQYSCLENPIDTRAWRATVHGVTKSRTRLRDCHSLSDKDIPDLSP